MKIYTVAGGGSSLADNGLATAVNIDATEGIWMDGNCNLYICDGSRKIRKVNTNTGIISTIAGIGTLGYTGDGNAATSAKISTYGLYSDAIGNVYTAEGDNNYVRKIDAITNKIITIAGGGTLPGDGGPATNAYLNSPRNVYGDNDGNIYIGEAARIRKINTFGIITTVAGNGLIGLSGDGGPATNAQVNYPQGMLFDNVGNFYFADRVNHRIRKIDSKGIITTYAGSSDGYSGDGGPATAAQLSGPISFVIDYSGGMVIGDNQNNYMRRVDPTTHIIKTIAGVGTSVIGSYAEGAPATAADIHPEFMYLDRAGNIYYSCFGGKIFKMTGYLPGLAGNRNDCGETAVNEVRAYDEVRVYPNPAKEEVVVEEASSLPSPKEREVLLYNTVGQLVARQNTTGNTTKIPVGKLPAGMYYISLRRENGVVVSRFVKE